MMSAKQMDETTITYVVGYIGLASIFFSTVSEIYSSLKAQKQRGKPSLKAQNIRKLDVECGEDIEVADEDRFVQEVRKGGVKVDVDEFQKCRNFYSNS
jgi:hypothetical protein